ncbi:hypothetical protein N0V94_004423 [Neodidymelliopsis sp. IMI 364377]|nr:hypothetical protein N0V94_004423 [Neodidymelliopsis sp. IMI 364377]
MHSLHSLRTLLFPFLALLSLVTSQPKSSHTFKCTGGSLYFTAHPVDSLLYQNPDLFHDLHVYKCITTVVFTSGDRGIAGNHSRSLEHGLEAAYAWMSGLEMGGQSWQTRTVQMGDGNVTLSSCPEVPSMQMLYLRLPDGGPAGQGYGVSNGESLRKLYTGDIKTITTTDGNATYTLDSLKGLLAAVLHESNATDIRVLDYKTGIPDEEDARYAGGFARKFDATLNQTSLDFERKIAAFLEYSAYDQHMCKTYDECQDDLESAAQSRLFPDNDVLYAAEALEREYYVS